VLRNEKKFESTFQKIPEIVLKKIEMLHETELVKWRSLCVDWNASGMIDLEPLEAYSRMRREHEFDPWSSSLTTEFRSLENFLGKLIMRKRGQGVEKERYG